MTEKNAIAPFARPLYVMLKPAGAHCNLACEYCYYLEKRNLYAGGTDCLMSESLLEKFTREYIESQTTQEVLFTWHGGEPLLRPLSFYQKAVSLQKRYAGGRQIDNALQTNGTLLTDDWCRFLKENRWLVGVSIDGPQKYHDAFRKSRSGHPSWQQTLKGIEKLNHYGVEWNAMAVVDSINAEHAAEVYDFFKKSGTDFLQFTPIVERILPHSDGRHLATPCDSAPLTPSSITPEQWGRFLCELFDLWVQNDVGRFFVQIFDATLANWCGVEPGLCTLSASCGHAAVMEHNGDVYSCDHFVFPEYKLGNINQNTIIRMLYGKRQSEFGLKKHSSLPLKCKKCEFLFACHGECPKNRFTTTSTGEQGLNYLCDGYREFFSHVKPYMDFMRDELNAQRPPSNVMQAIKQGMLPRPAFPEKGKNTVQ